jgi:murein L,D-transpeptidase YcbB/YkuD
MEKQVSINFKYTNKKSDPTSVWTISVFAASIVGLFLLLGIVLFSSNANATEYPNKTAAETNAEYPHVEPVVVEIPKRMPQYELIVNRNNYTMDVYVDDALVESRKVIVGKPGRETPTIEAEVSHIELNPVWDVPHSITDDMVRKFKQKGVDYIVRNGYHLYDKADGSEIDPHSIDWKTISGNHPYEFIIKQDPGPLNMLGPVMFVLKGTGGVQMHGTANPELFEKETRRFSSGCIRVDGAAQLAAAMLDKSEDEFWKLSKKVGNKWIKLETPAKVKVID